ncbi:MAG: aminopeptidase N [Hyphomicrobiaceae bacterium]
MKTDTPRPIYLKDYRPPEYLIPSVDLDIALAPHETRVRSRLKVRRNPKSGDGPAPLHLDGVQLHLDRLAIDGVALRAGDYELTEGGLVVPRPPEKAFTLDAVTLIDPDANKALSGLYRSRGIYCTQCEAEGFRRITYFLDRPDVLSRYRTRIEADIDEAGSLLSNGNLVERGNDPRRRRHYAVWKDPFPKPCYLFALVGGNLSSTASSFRTMSGRDVELRIYTEPGKEERCVWALDALKRSMRWDEERFAREYDLDVFMIVAVSDFNMGAMENKGLNIFNDRLILATPETATDFAYEAIEAVVAHEYFHNWTGNRITCRDWFQLCLKEGLTVFRDQEFSADERSATVQRIADVRQLKAHQFPEDAGPLAHPVRPGKYIEINNFYTATVYEKGAELCRMIETIVGRAGFRAGMDLFFDRHDGEAATVEDFLACFEEATGADLTQFAVWYQQAGTPELVCSFSYDAARKEAELKIEQVLKPTPGETRKRPLHIPVRLGLVAPDGSDMPLRLASGEEVAAGVLHVRKRSETHRFVDVAQRPVPSLLRGFSAPVNLTLDISDRDLEFLMQHDGDLYNRWEAAQALATRTIVEIVHTLRAGKRTGRGTAFAKALEKSIADPRLEPAYRAQLLTLPSDGDIARQIGRDVDPQAIHRARTQLLRLIGRELSPLLESLYEKMRPPGRFAPDAASAGKRALRNAALALLAARGRPEDTARVAAHYHAARNMTDQSAALGLLADVKGPERERAFEHFYDRWHDDHIVIDRWFSAQAMSSLPDAPERVRGLLRHPLFSMTNPNKVRALVGAFAMGNPLRFNNPDGQGYDLVADAVLELDGFNAAIAARLLSSFRSWRTLEVGRRRRAQRALQRIARRKGLSKDVFEIVGKTLEQD